MAHIYDFAEFQVERRADTHGWTFSTLGRKDVDFPCPHLHLLFDENGHTVDCKDCGKTVSAWWAFMQLVERFEHEWEKIKNARLEIEAAEKRVLTHKAAIAVEDAWRRRKTIPTCPHCYQPILPGEGFGRSGASQERTAKAAKPIEMRPNLGAVDSEGLTSPDSGLKTDS